MLGEIKEEGVLRIKDMLEEERWMNTRIRIVRDTPETKIEVGNLDCNFYREKKIEVIDLESAEEEEKDEGVDMEEEEEKKVEDRPERCFNCKSFSCRGALTARQCPKCHHLTLKCMVGYHRRRCSTH